MCARICSLSRGITEMGSGHGQIDELILDGQNPWWMNWRLSRTLGIIGRWFEVLLWRVHLVPGFFSPLFLFPTFPFLPLLSFTESVCWKTAHHDVQVCIRSKVMESDDLGMKLNRPKHVCSFKLFMMSILSQLWKADWQRWTISSFSPKNFGNKHNNPFPFIS